MNIQGKREEKLTPEYRAATKAMYEKIAKGEYVPDCSEIPELDEFDFKYSIPLGELLAMTKEQRHKVGEKMLAAEEADRAAKRAQQDAKKAQQEAETAIAEARKLAHQT